MRKKKIILTILIIAFAMAAAWFGIARFSSKKSFAADEGIAFSFTDSSGCPEGWQVVSYENKYACSVSDGVVMLHSDTADDLRIVKTVPCEGSTVYVLSGYMRAENVSEGKGVTLSVDNYSVDGSYVYSEGLYGTADWVYKELCFKTMPEQTELRLALRMGGYNEVSSGTASFRDITFKRDNTRTDYATLSANGKASADENKDVAVWNSEKLKSMFAVMEWVTVFVGCFWICCIYRNKDKLESLSVSRKNFKLIFAAIVVLGLLIRAVLCAVFKGHDTDMKCFIRWGQDIAANGPRTFYTAAGHEWYDYPPGYMLFLGLWSRIINVFISDPESVPGMFMYMLPAIAADYGCAKLFMREAGKQGMREGAQLLIGGFVFLNPALLYLSGAWGQIDSILTLLLLYAFLLLLREKRVLSGLMFGIAVLIKWQALMFGPVYAAAHILLAVLPDEKISCAKKLVKTGLGALAAFGVILLASLPFRNGRPLFWLITKFINSASGYDYASVEAYNYMSLCGGNWTKASEPIASLPFSYKQMGTVFILFSLVIGILMLITQSKERQSGLDRQTVAGRAAVLSAALTMAMIFTFGHYMHERYIIPAILFVILAYILYKDKRLLLVAMLFTLTTFLNEMTAMFALRNEISTVVWSSALHKDVAQICAFSEVCACIYFIRVCFVLTTKTMPNTETKA